MPKLPRRLAYALLDGFVCDAAEFVGLLHASMQRPHRPVIAPRATRRPAIVAAARERRKAERRAAKVLAGD